MESTGESTGRANRFGFWFGLALFLLVLAFPVPQERVTAKRTAAVTLLVATWWVTEAIPIPATSLLPLALFPLLGILDIKEVAPAYGKAPVFLFLGGFILALGIERWNLHRRIALLVIRTIGMDPRRMVLGFMTASALLSMWISNTATTLMMLPIALAIVASLETLNSDREAIRHLGVALMLGIAYAANIGGLSTLIGTPPNLVLGEQLDLFFEGRAPELSMGRWILTFLPLSVVFLAIAWRFLVRRLKSDGGEGMRAATRVIEAEWRALGPMTAPERRMLAIFAVTALLWIFRGNLDLGPVVIPGWTNLLAKPDYVGDAVVAVFMAGLTFIVPSGDSQSPGRPLMDWPTALGLPWGILLLFGAGFAIAMGFKESGLSQWLGEQLGQLPVASPLLLVLATCTLMTFLTELTSNVATATVMLPILASTAVGAGVDPLLLMLPATISASCAFMLPVATPPNAIVFSSGRVAMREMVSSGLFLNLVGILLVTATVYLLGVPILNIAPQGKPDWVSEEDKQPQAVESLRGAVPPTSSARQRFDENVASAYLPESYETGVVGSGGAVEGFSTTSSVEGVKVKKRGAIENLPMTGPMR